MLHFGTVPCRIGAYGAERRLCMVPVNQRTGRHCIHLHFAAFSLLCPTGRRTSDVQFFIPVRCDGTRLQEDDDRTPSSRGLPQPKGTPRDTKRGCCKSNLTSRDFRRIFHPRHERPWPWRRSVPIPVLPRRLITDAFDKIPLPRKP
ncbi:hypothetical protein D3C72_1750110 [compost metagenome]